ncbi:MAG: hypothetical protein ATN31_03615 [Candidatus Epulonipiscioides saccharophilum]|nr:MAG: hypothetical protein ATN31_03615 [Epulopiscium sp. AS2M-Bin001]
MLDFKLRCNNFILNWNIIDDVFEGTGDYIYPVCSYLFIDEEKILNEKILQEYLDIFNQHQEIFSNFSGDHIPALFTCLLASMSNPTRHLKNAIQFYKELCQHFQSSEYLMIGAIFMVDVIRPNQYIEIAKRTKDIYDIMEGAHRILTAKEHIVFAMFMAASARSNTKYIVNASEYYNQLKKKFSAGGPLLSISYAISMYDWTNKPSRVINLFDILVSNKLHYGTSHELSTLGVAAMSNAHLKLMAPQIVTTNKILFNLKNYGNSISAKKAKLAHASMIVSSVYPHAKTDTMDKISIKTSVARYSLFLTALAGKI